MTKCKNCGHEIYKKNGLHFNRTNLTIGGTVGLSHKLCRCGCVSPEPEKEEK